MKLTSVKSFQQTVTDAEGRIDAVIGSKLASFFELAEYNWMAPRPQSTVGEPSTYVFEMITFLTAYVDSVLIGLNEDIKTRAYRNALARINNWLMVRPPFGFVLPSSKPELMVRICYVGRMCHVSTRRHCRAYWPMLNSSKMRSGDSSDRPLIKS